MFWSQIGQIFYSNVRLTFQLSLTFVFTKLVSFGVVERAGEICPSFDILQYFSVLVIACVWDVFSLNFQLAFVRDTLWTDKVEIWLEASCRQERNFMLILSTKPVRPCNYLVIYKTREHEVYKLNANDEKSIAKASKKENETLSTTVILSRFFVIKFVPSPILSVSKHVRNTGNRSNHIRLQLLCVIMRVCISLGKAYALVRGPSVTLPCQQLCLLACRGRMWPSPRDSS